MSKLNQIIAIEKGIKARAYSAISELHKVIQKPALFNGFTKTYKRKDEDDGEELPDERQLVQFNAPEILQQVKNAISELLEVTARKDWTNCIAKGNVEVDGQTVIMQAPVSFLLFLEKQLTDLRTFADNLPVLDHAENWSRDPNSGMFRADESKTHRTRKIAKPIVLYPATPEHPAQTQMVAEDIIVGFWHQVKHSGAMPKPDQQALVERIEKLLRAVKQAREEANVQDETAVPKISTAVFAYLLEGVV